MLKYTVLYTTDIRSYNDSKFCVLTNTVTGTAPYVPPIGGSIKTSMGDLCRVIDIVFLPEHNLILVEVD